MNEELLNDIIKFWLDVFWYILLPSSIIGIVYGWWEWRKEMMLSQKDKEDAE